MDSKKKEHSRVHFIGIGGIGMSALARYFLANKWIVSGSDATESVLTKELQKEGIKVIIGHKKSNITKEVNLVIYNRAILSNNPEIIAAKKNKGTVVIPYAKALGEITQEYETIAITGSHGKSTTTALAGLALVKGGLDPTILVGTKLADLKGKNIRIGKGAYLVLEADDYAGAFLDYSPAIAIVTNIDKEHMDFYKNFSNVKKAFMQFLSNTRPGGSLILNADDSGLYSLHKNIATLAKKNNLNVTWHSMGTMSNEVKKIKKNIAIPGEHNISNALAVMQLGKLLKISESKILDALASYKGAWRRMEYKGKFISSQSQALVYDDYAHHPTEIKATLAAFRAKFPDSTLICIFQPHQAKRLELLFKDFSKAFGFADAVFILPLYKVLGRDEKFIHDSEALVEALKKREPKKNISYVDQPTTIHHHIELFLKNLPQHKSLPSPVVIMMGAGDIADFTEKLLH